MIDFVGITPFLRIPSRVAMATMHFHIAQTDLFVRNIFFLHLGVHRSKMGTHEKLSWACKVGR